MLNYISLGRTHKGAVRPHNEDSILDQPSVGLWAVADGMGGHKAGDVASQTIIRELSQISTPTDGKTFAEDVQHTLRNVNRILFEKGSAISDEMTMGSTVVTLTVCEGSFTVVWAGDSRMYRLRDHQIEQITRDHSYVQELVEQGQIDPADAEKHPRRNVITRAVGADQDIKLDTLEGEIKTGDIFFLCTDGVSNVISDSEISGLLDTDNLPMSADKIVSICLERGAPDNLSFVVAVMEPQQIEAPEPKKTSLGWLPSWIKRRH